MPIRIREWDPARDLAGVRACLVELQDEEREEYPNAPSGEAIADEYLEWLQAQMSECDGRLWVADEDGAVVGVAALLTRIARSSPDDALAEHAAVDILTLRDGKRGRGLGAELLATAETYARSAGVPAIRIGHHGRNRAAHRFYEREGYETIAVFVEKRL